MARFSSCVVVGDSPVVPLTTRPSLPSSTRRFARAASVGTSNFPSASNGVTIAVRSRPNGGPGLPAAPGEEVVMSAEATVPGSRTRRDRHAPNTASAEHGIHRTRRPPGPGPGTGRPPKPASIRTCRRREEPGPPGTTGNRPGTTGNRRPALPESLVDPEPGALQGRDSAVVAGKFDPGGRSARRPDQDLARIAGDDRGGIALARHDPSPLGSTATTPTPALRSPSRR